MEVLLGVVTVIDENGWIDGRPRWSTGYAAHTASEVVADDDLTDRRGHGDGSAWRCARRSSVYVCISRLPSVKRSVEGYPLHA